MLQLETKILNSKLRFAEGSQKEPIVFLEFNEKEDETKPLNVILGLFRLT